MGMIGNATYRERRHSVLAGDTAKVGVKTFSHSLPDQRPPPGGAEHNVNQTADMAVRHSFSRPLRDSQLWLAIQPSTGFGAKTAAPNRAGLLSYVPSGLARLGREFPARCAHTDDDDISLFGCHGS